MFVRSTQQMITQSAIEFARQHSARLAELQRQISTGIRIHRPSDDPVAMRSVVTQQFIDHQFDMHRQNMDVASSHLNASVSQLLAAKDLMLAAKEVAFESRQTTDRMVLVDQIDQMIERLHVVANARFDGQYLFAGTAVGTSPFEFDRGDPRGRAVYRGSDLPTQVTVGVQLTAQVGYSGQAIFQPVSRQASRYVTATGAAAGQGTDSDVGFGTLVVRHVATTYAGASGIAPGTSSAAGDTILGPDGTHRVTIDNVAQTISLNGGPPTSYSGTETDLQLWGPLGETALVDVTGLAAGFQGEVAISTAGTLSVDGGVTETPIDYSANQSVVHGENGAVTYVDSSGIQRAGVAHVEYVGTADAFGVLVELRRDLLNERGLTESEWQESITRRLADLDRVHDHLLDVVGQQSATLSNLESIRAHHEDLQLETRRVISDLQSTDLPAAIAELQLRQTLLQTTYATTANLFNTSLLDYLR